MNIRKHNADEHTVMGYASYCACSLAVTICSCSTIVCDSPCIDLGGGNMNTATSGQALSTIWNNDLRNHSSNSSQSRATG